MQLDEVPVVDLSYCYKFIVVKLTDRNGTTKVVVRTGRCAHNDILIDLEREELGDGAHGIKAECLGGGMIQITSQKIIISGSSLKFGREPNRSETLRIIQLAHPNYQVEML